jgi:hypothetical protein
MQVFHLLPPSGDSDGEDAMRRYKRSLVRAPFQLDYLRPEHQVNLFMDSDCHIEPVVGYEKQDRRLGRNHFKGEEEGDCINALLSGCGFNLRKLLRAFSCALKSWLSGLVFKLRTGLQLITGFWPLFEARLFSGTTTLT